MGKTLGDFCHPQDHDTLHELVRRVFSSGQGGCHRVLAGSSTGRERWYEGYFGPIYEQGKIVAASLIAVDATTRIQAEAELVDNRAILQTAVDNLPFEFFAIGEDGRYILQNAVSHEHYGDTIGKRPEDVAPDEYTRRLWLENNRRASAGERLEGEVEAHIGGEKRTYVNIISPIKQDGKVRGILGVNVDITERKRAEQALQKGHDDLEQRVEERTAELKTANSELRASEERLRLAQQIAQMGTFEGNLETGEIIWTPELEALHGLSPGEFPRTRLAWENMVHADDRAAVSRLIQQCLQTTETVCGEWRVVWPDGSVHWLAASWQAFYNKPGKPLRVIGVNADITERKRAEEELRQSNQQFHTIYDGIVEGLLITDIETKRIRRVNAPFCRMLGYSEKELVGMSIPDLHPPEEVPNDLQRFQAAAEGRVSINEDRPVLRKDGSVFYADILGHPIVYEGKPCLLALFRDITERKHAQEALAKQHRTLKHLLQSSDRERQLIAYEIHDGLAQQLAGAIMQFQTFDHLKDRTPRMRQEHTKPA